MGSVTSLFVRKMVAGAEPGVDGRSYLRSVGIDPDGDWDPKQMITDDAYYGLLEAIADEIDVTGLPVKVGHSMCCDEYGALGLAWKAAPTLRGSYMRVERFARIWTSIVAYEIQPLDDGIVWIEHRAGERRLGMRLSVEADMASAVSISRQVSPVPFRPDAVYFKHAAPRTLKHHEAYFECPVHFEAQYDGLAISNQALDQPNKLGDEGITRFLLPHLEGELSDVKDEPTLGEITKDAIARALSEGPPKMEEIARGLGFSARSFHRRLADHGLTFQMLAEETRRELAEGLLRDEQYTLADVAFLTGFS
ncbi:MAG: AraC family transcriptional regulator ligand-binding domain-containing protein, partial [Pseudomonadota bacterium]